MPPSSDASAIKPAEPGAGALPVRPLRTRGLEPQSLASSTASLPYRAANPSVSSLFASTANLPGSRAASPGGNVTPRIMSGSVFEQTPGEGHNLLPSDRADDPRNLILQAIVPHVAVYGSDDTEELVKDKGFQGGLWELLRPFGEKIQGKVTVRDSIGAGKVYDDFSVRFVQLGDGQLPEAAAGFRTSGEGKALPGDAAEPATDFVAGQTMRTGGDVGSIETLVDRHLTHAEEYPNLNGAADYFSAQETTRQADMASPFYTLFLRRLLSGLPLQPHETFSHPVACVIAISSRNPNPIDTLRNLYEESSRGEKRLPLWVNNDYLRYYVLVHDEERDDITNSMNLFERMKRHFGLHCHLLRLRSSQCVATDDDSVRLPQCQWLSASEEIAIIRARETEEEVEESYPCIFESDTTAIKTFIREMVTQSVIPSMERCVQVWNEQVASRRRGITGRLLKISKWTGFGGNSRTASTNNNPSGSNYDAVQGFYRPDAAEAIMRKLADYAFMLRDWKMAQSTYDLLRSDFNNDKAWHYHAATNEMAAISTLMLPHTMSAKTRSETIDQMLADSAYSYITRCGAAYGALRSLALGMELLRLRDGSATADAARWGTRILEYKVVGIIGDALVKERISVCYASKTGSGSGHWGSRVRKSALWSMQAADSWLTLGKPQQSKQCLYDATTKYSSLIHKDSILQFSHASEFLQALEKEVQLAIYPESAIEAAGTADLIDTAVAEESEEFNSRPHRRSLMGGGVSPFVGLESAPLHGTLLESESEEHAPDEFE